MLSVPHPEVLHHDFVPPVLRYRAPELERLHEALRAPGGAGGVAWVTGPEGSGSSALARLAARRCAEELRREAPGAPAPLVAAVRVRWCHGSQSLAAALLQHLDDGFHPTGFPTNEILAGFVRRLRREGRAGIVVLDDIGRSAPDLRPVLRAVLSPERFLPEGVDEPPCLRLLLAGAQEAAGAWSQVGTLAPPTVERVELSPYGPRELEAIVRDRLERALGRSAPEPLATEVAARAAREGGGASRALELLRRRLLSDASASVRPTLRLAPGDNALALEPHLVAALDRAVGVSTASLGELRAWEARLAREQGVRPLPLTTMWRRLLKLEAMGLLRRSVRPGGPGGTRSTLELLTPVAEWPVRRAPSRSRPGVGLA